MKRIALLVIVIAVFATAQPIEEKRLDGIVAAWFRIGYSCGSGAAVIRELERLDATEEVSILKKGWVESGCEKWAKLYRIEDVK